MRIVLIGAVRSSEVALRRLLAHGVEVAGVFGYRAPDVSQVSGYVDLEPLARSAGVPFYPFRSVNAPEIVAAVRSLSADVLFVVGLSQLVGAELLRSARLGGVGYHPTALPHGRGRAPIAWLVLEQRDGASTLFELTEGTDAGGIFVQEPFAVAEDDDASAVESKVLSSLERALDKWLPRLKNGEWNPVAQDEQHATYYGKRAPEDGLIDWRSSAREIDRLVKASTRPHPGAFTYRKDERLIVWRSKVETNLPIRGVRGRVLAVNGVEALVQAGEGLLWLLEYEGADGHLEPLRVGEKLGYDTEIALNALMRRLAKLEEKSS